MIISLQAQQSKPQAARLVMKKASL